MDSKTHEAKTKSIVVKYCTVLSDFKTHEA